MASAASVDARRVLETQLIQKAWKDADFCKEVVRDPKGMLEKHLGQKLPAQLKIFIHEEDANTLHFSVPPAPASVSELSDEDLEKVAGGTDIVLTVAISGLVTVTAVGASVGLTKSSW